MPPDKPLSIRLLEGKKIQHTVLVYDPDQHASATEVAEAIGRPPEQVFKTLVTEPQVGKPILAVVPSNRELDLKMLARAAGQKKVRMASQADAEAMTGLQKGGISALALLNRGFRVYLDRSALRFEQIAMSAGQRGVQVLLAPADFVKLTQARVDELT